MRRLRAQGMAFASDTTIATGSTWAVSILGEIRFIFKRG